MMDEEVYIRDSMHICDEESTRLCGVDLVPNSTSLFCTSSFIVAQALSIAPIEDKKPSLLDAAENLRRPLLPI
jgi:hypothetical protein